MLTPHLARRSDRSFFEKAQAGMKKWREKLHQRAQREETPIKPQVVAEALNDLLADDAIVSADCGTVAAFAARYSSRSTSRSSPTRAAPSDSAASGPTRSTPRSTQ